MTPADELFFWLAFDSIRTDPDLLAVLRRKEAFRRNPLCWISFPGDMVEGDEIAQPPDFAPLFTGQRAVLLECLQPHLDASLDSLGADEGADRRLEADAAAGSGGVRRAASVPVGRRCSANAPISPGSCCERTLPLFTADMTPVFWTGGLQGSGPPRLADRLDTQRAALALPRQMEILEAWQQQALGVGYFDDGLPGEPDVEVGMGSGPTATASRPVPRAAVEMLEPLRGPSESGQPAAGDGAAASEKVVDSPDNGERRGREPDGKAIRRAHATRSDTTGR